MADDGYRETRWGRVCIALYARMQKRIPALRLSVGLDEGKDYNAPPVVTFVHAGAAMKRPVGTGGGGDSVHHPHPFDDVTDLGVECWGSSPLEAEDIKRELGFAMDAEAHGRAGEPGRFQPSRGSQYNGDLGAKEVGMIQLRIAVDRPARGRVPTSIGVTAAVAITGGDGQPVQPGEEVALS